MMSHCLTLLEQPRRRSKSLVAPRDAEGFGHFAVMLGLCWGYIGVISGLYWGYAGVILGFFWGYIGAILGLFWG